MSIVKNTPYILKHTHLSSTTILNDTISQIKDPCILGIYTYLLSRPSDYPICEADLQQRFGKHIGFIRQCLIELQTLGLIDKEGVL